MRENTDLKNSEYGHFSRSDNGISPFQSNVAFHVETSHLICIGNFHSKSNDWFLHEIQHWEKWVGHCFSFITVVGRIKYNFPAFAVFFQNQCL